MKKLFGLLIAGGFLFTCIMCWKVISFMATPASNEHHEVIFEVSPGMAFGPLANQLERKGVISDARIFTLISRLMGQSGQVKVGEYQLFTDMQPKEILSILTSGKSILHSIVVPEGYNIFEIRDLLNTKWPGKGDEFFSFVTNKENVKALIGIQAETLEGYLFPETYNVTKFTPVRVLVEEMVSLLKKTIAEVNPSATVQMDLHKQVILASVIEKETGAPEEREIISSVFHNRLKKGMRLQSDPTIIYGMMMETKEYVKNIKKEDILRSTPYNTYTVPALPVGPVSNPGREALAAAVRPATTNFLYFVSMNEGRHKFSETYEGHKEAVKTHQMDSKARSGKSWRQLKAQKPEKKI